MKIIRQGLIGWFHLKNLVKNKVLTANKVPGLLVSSVMCTEADIIKESYTMGNKKIAVIGLGCFYAGSKNPMELWENVLTKRQQFRDFPGCRLPLTDYYDRNKKIVDKTYSRLGAFIDGFIFDWKQKRIPKAIFDSADLVHWLALDVAEQALIDSGYTQGQVPKERIGVIVGNSMNGEISRANSLRLRWPFVSKVFREVASVRGFGDDEIKLIDADLEKSYKAFFPPMTGG